MDVVRKKSFIDETIRIPQPSKRNRSQLNSGQQIPTPSIVRVGSRQHSTQPKGQSEKLKKVFGGGLISLFNRYKPRLSVRQINDQNQQQKIRISNLFKASNQISHKDRIKKAFRHFDDALNLRKIRNDVELNPNKLINMIYKIQISPFVQDVLFKLSLVYMALTFNEPPNRYVIEPLSLFNYYTEIFLICAFWLDIVFEVIHLYFDVERSHSQKYYRNGPFVFKILFQIVLTLDFIIFYSLYDKSPLRFARYIRPFLMFVYEKELRRSLKSILYSFQEIIQLLLFVIILTMFWSLVGLKIIGNLDNQVQYQQYGQNFDNIWTSYIILYALITPEGYPSSMLPALEVSNYYLIYFLPYIILYQLLFAPIPVAIVFDAYRNNRGKLVILDRLKQREALLACFISLDFEDKKSIQFEVFQEFMKQVYLGSKRQCKLIPGLFSLMDVNGTNSLPIIGFFEIIDHIERDTLFAIPEFPDRVWWQKFRKFMNLKLKIKTIVRSTQFELMMFLIVIVNCGIVVTLMIIDGPDGLVTILTSIDDYSVYLYLTESCIKLIGLGLDKYFEDGWNKFIITLIYSFDFAMVVISLAASFFQSLLSVLKSAKTLKSSKILRLARLNRMFRALRALRTLKIINFLVIGADTLVQLKVMVQRIIICLPLVFKLIPIILMLFYIWAVIGMELWNTDTFTHQPNSPYNSLSYADFSNFGGSLLVLLQITLETQWDLILYDYAYKFEDLSKAIIFFVPFHMIMQLILLSLVKGIIWEVFMIVEETTKAQTTIQEKKDENLQLEQISIVNSERRLDDLASSHQKVNQKLLGFQEYENILINLSFGEKLSAVQCELREDTRPQDSPHRNKYKDTDQGFPYESQMVSNSPQQQKEQKSLNISIDSQNDYMLIDGNSPSKVTSEVPNSTPVLNFRKLSNQSVLSEKFNSIKFFPMPHKSSNLTASNDNAADKQINIPTKMPSNPHDPGKLLKMMSFEAGSVESDSSSQESDDMHTQTELFTLFILSKLKHKKHANLTHDRSNYVIDQDDEISVGSFMKTVVQILIHDDEPNKNKMMSPPRRVNNSLTNGFPVGLPTRVKADLPQLNQNYVLKKALLREASQKKIQRLEQDYFKQQYGTIFDTFKDLDLNPLLKFQAIHLQSFEMMLRYNSQDYMPTVSMITALEQSVSQTLLPRGSMLKFIFMDSLENWFHLHNQDEIGLIPVKSGSGPWDLYSQIDQGAILIGSDFFHPPTDIELNSSLEGYFHSMKKMISTMVKEKSIMKYKSSIVDLFLMQKQSVNKVNLDVKSHKFVSEMKIPLFEQLAIKVSRVMVVLLNYQGDVQLQVRRQGIRHTEKQAAHSPHTMIKKLTMEKLKFKSTHEKDFLSDKNNFLSIPYIFEFMESLKMILDSRVDNLLIKMTQFVNGRVSDLHNQSPH